VPQGVIVGGWSYVIAAYAVVAIGLAIYAISLFQRLRSARRQLEAAAGATPATPRGGTDAR
jgi:CcmD family protein